MVSANSLLDRKVLVVDDEPDVRTYLRALLEDEGAVVYEAPDGVAAIELARMILPDLITLDLSMSGLDGVDTYKALRRDPELCDIAVCIVTGHPEFRKVLYSREVSPPEGFLTKPIDIPQLLGDLRRILALRERRNREN